MTTSALEKRTGVPRTTIYFYVRQGLLPEPQRTATGRSLFGEQHVALLWKIGELKRRGYTLPDIKKALEKDIARARESDVDLAELEDARVRSAIIEVASEEFEANGYKGTHVMAIIQKLGINPHIFYRHFPSKFDLLLECFKASTPLPLDGESAHDGGRHCDPARTCVRGLTSDYRWHQLSAALAAGHPDRGSAAPETARRVAEVWDAIIINVLRDFERAAESRAAARVRYRRNCSPTAMFGAYRSASHAGLLGRQVLTPKICMRAHLFVFFAVIAAVRGEVDIQSRVGHVRGAASRSWPPA